MSLGRFCAFCFGVLFVFQPIILKLLLVLANVSQKHVFSRFRADHETADFAGISKLKQRGKRGTFLILVYFKGFLAPWSSCTAYRWYHSCCMRTQSWVRAARRLSLRLCLWKRCQVWEPVLLFVILISSHMHTDKPFNVFCILAGSPVLPVINSLLASSHFEGGKVSLVFLLLGGR